MDALTRDFDSLTRGSKHQALLLGVYLTARSECVSILDACVYIHRSIFFTNPHEQFACRTLGTDADGNDEATVSGALGDPGPKDYQRE